MHLQLNRSNLHIPIEMLLSLMFAISISLWKPGIYVSSGAILLYALTRLAIDSAYRHQLFQGWIPKAAVGLYALGLIASCLHADISTDLATFARKGMFLLIAAPLLLIFQSPKNRMTALVGLCCGLWIASVMNLMMMDQLLSNQRLTATWDVGVWGLSSGLMVSFLVPFILENPDHKQRIWLAASLGIALVILLLTTARGPWVATLASILMYLLLVKRKLFIYVLIAIAAAYWPAKHFAPEAVAAFSARASSIVDTNNESNKIRLHLWSLALTHLQEKQVHSPATFWFGSGLESHVKALNEHFASTDKITNEQKAFLSERDYPGNDLHNMYIDTIAKMGVLWAPLSVLFLIALGLHCLRLSQANNRLPLAGVLVIVNFMIVGFFYDIMLHFGTFFLIFFVALAAQSHTNLRQSQ